MVFANEGVGRNKVINVMVGDSSRLGLESSVGTQERKKEIGLG